MEKKSFTMSTWKLLSESTKKSHFELHYLNYNSINSSWIPASALS